MKTLTEVMNEAWQEGRAIGHFNISDSTQLHAICRAASDLSVPVVIGVSEGEVKFVGLSVARAMVDAVRSEYAIDIYLNADHVHSVDGCKRAIDAGFDSVIFDGSKGSMEDNLAGTKEVVAYAEGRNVVVEAEVGYIGASSKMLDDVPEDVVSAALPSAEEVAAFVRESGVGAVAPAVGNVHGMLKSRANPSLHIDLVREIREAIGDSVGMVLHGGSGITNDDFKAAIVAGMNVVHINTEIRRAYRKGIESALHENTDEIAPYRYLAPGRDAVEEVVRARLALFNNL